MYILWGYNMILWNTYILSSDIMKVFRLSVISNIWARTPGSWKNCISLMTLVNTYSFCTLGISIVLYYFYHKIKLHIGKIWHLEIYPYFIDENPETQEFEWLAKGPSCSNWWSQDFNSNLLAVTSKSFREHRRYWYVTPETSLKLFITSFLPELRIRWNSVLNKTMRSTWYRRGLNYVLVCEFWLSFPRS